MDKMLDQQAMRQRLQDELQRIEARIATRLGDKNEGRNPDRSELAQAYTSRERNTALLALERRQLQQVQDALQRLEEGTYGNCTGCGQAIRPERLEIIPYATLCVSCQAQQE